MCDREQRVGHIMAEEMHEPREQFIQKGKKAIDALRDGAWVYLDFDETIVINDPESNEMVLNPDLLELMRYAQQRNKSIHFALLTSTPRWVWDENTHLNFPRVLAEKNVRRRPAMEYFEEEIGWKMDLEIFEQEQNALLNESIPTERLVHLFGDDFEHIAKTMYQALLNTTASPLEEDIKYKVEHMFRQSDANFEEVIQYLFNAAIKLKYMILAKKHDGTYRHATTADMLLLDDKRGGTVGELLHIGIEVPRTHEERQRYIDTADWEDVLLKVYSALHQHGLHPRLSKSKIHSEDASDTEVYVRSRARTLRDSLTLISVVEAIHSAKFASDPLEFYRYLIQESEDESIKAIDESLYVYIDYPVGEVVVKLDLRRLKERANKSETDPAEMLGQVFDDLAHTVLLSLEDRDKNRIVEDAPYDEKASRLFSRVFIGLKTPTTIQN